MIETSDKHGRVLVFDSGIGGATVALELRRRAPGVSIDYAMDTGFFPYGDKSDAALRARLPRVAQALAKAADPDVFVIACNTASTLALDDVRAVLSVPVVGTVPAIKPAVAASRTGAIGLLATPGTIRRAYTDRLIADFAAGAQVVKHGSIDLVRLAEDKAAGREVALADVAAAQAPLFEGESGARIDTVVLACTHFPLLAEELARTAPRPVAYLDSGEAIARRAVELLPGQSDKAGPARSWVTSQVSADGKAMQSLARLGWPAPQRVDVAQSEDCAAGRNGTTSPEAA